MSKDKKKGKEDAHADCTHTRRFDVIIKDQTGKVVNEYKGARAYAVAFLTSDADKKKGNAGMLSSSAPCQLLEMTDALERVRHDIMEDVIQKAPKVMADQFQKLLSIREADMMARKMGLVAKKAGIK